MHDPCTQAFEIKRPWPIRSGFGGWYWPALVTIWHVDPETDGSDDSCGWSRAKLSEAGKKVAQELYDEEQSHPYYFTMPRRIRDSKYPYHEILPGDLFVLVLGILSDAAWRLHRKRRIEDKLFGLALQLSIHPHDNLAACFALEPSESDYHNIEKMKRAFYIVVQHYENSLRPWYKHPRWHLWHWEISVKPIIAFKRWAFSRCATCKKGFSWGYAPISDSWDSAGPLWFKGERGVRHHDCRNPASENVGQVAR